MELGGPGDLQPARLHRSGDSTLQAVRGRRRIHLYPGQELTRGWPLRCPSPGNQSRGFPADELSRDVGSCVQPGEPPPLSLVNSMAARLLLVDDEAALAELLKKYLERLGYE